MNIKIHFTGRLGDGTVFATSALAEPLEFEVGRNEVLPQIEEAATKLAVGESTTIRLTCDEAFGPVREDLCQELAKESLPPDVAANIKVGDQLWMETPQEEPLLVSVAEISEESVILDANHPLAGEDLTFTLERVL